MATPKDNSLVINQARDAEKNDFGRDSSISSQQQQKADGSVLEPRPSTSPNDPLNWSWAKKHAVLAALLPGCFLTDWTLTWGTTMFEMQAHEWHMSVEDVSHSINPGIFMQGPGGILAVPLCQRYGRLPVLFWSQLLSLVVTIAAAGCPDYASFTAMRTLQGFFGAPPQVIGMSIIHDMFFFHERARKINIWAASFLIGPYLGPFISGLLAIRLNWRENFGVLAGFYAFSTLMVVFFGDETLFEREGLDKVDTTKAVTGTRRPFSLKRHISALIGIEGFKNRAGRPGLWTVFWHMCELLVRPYVFLPCVFFVMPITMWLIGMVATISQFVLPPVIAGGYGFSYLALSMLYFAPMIGTLLGEAWGHWFNDFIAHRYMARLGLEVRLAACYPAVLIGAAGLVLFGQTLDKQLSWVGLAFGWAMLCFGSLANMVAISTYLLDCLPQHAALAGAWLNFWRVIGGFTVTYFQMVWVRRNGPGLSFGSQAIITVGAALAIVATQIWGKRWRNRFPAPAAEN